MKSILVTGVNGFVGHHVSKRLHEDGYKVIGVGTQPRLQGDLLNIVKEYTPCDLINPEEVGQLDLSHVSAIINLAGFAKVGESRGQGELYDKVNIGVHTTLYDECINQGTNPRIVAVSTGAVYDPNQELPLSEDSRIIDETKGIEYIASKIKMERAVRKYKEKGLNVILARPFNQTGPGQLPGFLVPDLGSQIEVAINENKPLLVGNLDTRRDFTDVRDVARAYVHLATCDPNMLNHDVYNICSGKSVSGREILKFLLEAYGASNISTTIDQSRIRTNEVMDIFGSYERLRSATGWNPEININKTIMDFVTWQKSK